MTRFSYHSSLVEPEEAYGCRRANFKNSLAFVHDMSKGPPKELLSCDIIYTEIAWRVGFGKFAERSNFESTFERYIKGIAELTRLGQDCIIVCGKREAKLLPQNYATKTPVNLNTGGRFIASAVALAYGSGLPEVKARHLNWTNIDTENLLSVLAEQYGRVGDPCCGYGNTGRVFKKRGREFVLSDSDPKCIGFIKEHISSW